MTPGEYRHHVIQQEGRASDLRLQRLERFAETQPATSQPPLYAMTQWEWEAYCDEQERLNELEDENAWRGGWAGDWHTKQ